MPNEELLRRKERLAELGLPSPDRAIPQFGVEPARHMTARPHEAVPQCLALVATRNYLPYAKLTARTFLAHHPGFKAFLLLVDGDQGDAALFPEGEIVLLSELGLHGAAWYATKFNATEFANALKPTFLRYLSRFVASAVYMDSDIAVFSPLNELVSLLQDHPLVLIPHMLAPLPRPEQFGTHPTRADIFNSGLINAGCFAIRLDSCDTFLKFWEEANVAPGAFYQEAGYQTDQQNLNWALVTVPGACVLRSTRYNVAYWNLHERDFRCRIVKTPAGRPTGQLRFEVDGEPLGFFHFSGYDVAERLRLSRHDQRHSVYNLPAVAEILNWYSDQVLSCPTMGLTYEPYALDRLANGFHPTKMIREILKKHEAQIPRLDLRSAEGADALCTFLMSPLPATGSMLPLIAAEIYELRPDLRRAFPHSHANPAPAKFWRWFCRHAGAEYGIQFLIDRFRRSLISDSLVGFAEEVDQHLGTHLKFLGPDRMEAALQLQFQGQGELAETLLEARTEWFFCTDLAAALCIYTSRPDLQRAFPDIIDRDHEAFANWLSLHATEEHGCPSAVGEKFRRCRAEFSLARLYSFMARREDVARICQESMLGDDPEPMLRCLLRSAGDGLEYDLDDVVLLQFIHQTSRQLLVPLYLELPLIRLISRASRLVEWNIELLPENVRGEAWAVQGCRLHAGYFDRFAACVDEEMRRLSDGFVTPPRDVMGFLRTSRRGASVVQSVEPVFRAAARRMASAEKATLPPEVAALIKQRRDCAGVNMFGYFYSDIGVGESTRGLASAVSLLCPVNPIPVCTGQIQSGVTVSGLFQRFDYLTDTNIFVSYPHQGEDLLGQMRPEYLSGRRNIAHLAWEQKDANPWWKIVYDRYDEIWAISDFAATPFREMFPGRVRVVPNVLDFDSFPIADKNRRPCLDAETLEFMFVFDANSSMERKNPEGALDAFIRAFKGTRHADRVRLTLKVGNMRRPEHAPRVRALTHTAEASGLDIRFDDRQLSRPDMLRLIAGADCYLSLHRAEGFGYTMAEAMFYGVPVIASGYSGNLEYMASDNSFLVPCKETFVKVADGPFQRGSIWGEPDLDAATDMIRQIAEKPGHAAQIGARGREAVLRKLSAAAVADVIAPSFRPERRTSGGSTPRVAAQ